MINLNSFEKKQVCGGEVWCVCQTEEGKLISIVQPPKTNLEPANACSIICCDGHSSAKWKLSSDKNFYPCLPPIFQSFYPSS